MEQQETTRGQRIADAFSYLRKSGIVKTQQEIADMMGANKTTVSQALNGNESYLTDKFLSRFNNAFGEMFNIAWLDIPKETIARALGHGGHSVTDIYIDFDRGKVDEANRQVIDYVLYDRK